MIERTLNGCAAAYVQVWGRQSVCTHSTAIVANNMQIRRHRDDSASIGGKRRTPFSRTSERAHDKRFFFFLCVVRFVVDRVFVRVRRRTIHTYASTYTFYTSQLQTNRKRRHEFANATTAHSHTQTARVRLPDMSTTKPSKCTFKWLQHTRYYILIIDVVCPLQFRYANHHK